MASKPTNDGSDSDDSDNDYVPEDKGGLSEEEDSGDAESDIEAEEDHPPSAKKRRKCGPKEDNKEEKKEKELDVEALWSDFKKETEPPKKTATPQPAHPPQVVGSGAFNPTLGAGSSALTPPLGAGSSALNPPLGAGSGALNPPLDAGSSALLFRPLGAGAKPLRPLGAGTGAPPRPTGGGLAGILGKIGKKDKMSMLEKSRQDWNMFKRAEGIEEDLTTHNRGKDGFLEKRDFLDRTDQRQFEIEKNLRTVSRSNR